MLPTQFRIIIQVVSEEIIFRNRPIRNKNCLWWPCLLIDRDEMSKLYRGPPINHLAKLFQKRRIFKINQSETRVSCGQHAHRFFHLGVHVPFYLLFWGVHPNFSGCNISSNSSFGSKKKMNCIFSTQGHM